MGFADLCTVHSWRPTEQCQNPAPGEERWESRTSGLGETSKPRKEKGRSVLQGPIPSSLCFLLSFQGLRPLISMLKLKD